MECGEGGGVRMGEAQNLALRSLSELLKSNTEPSGKMSEDRSVVEINKPLAIRMFRNSYI